MLDPQTSLDSIFFPIPSFMAWKGLDPWVSMWLPIGADHTYPWDQTFNTFCSCYGILPSFNLHDASTWGRWICPQNGQCSMIFSLKTTISFFYHLCWYWLLSGCPYSRNATQGSSRNLTPLNMSEFTHFQRLSCSCLVVLLSSKKIFSKNGISLYFCWWCSNFQCFM